MNFNNKYIKNPNNINNLKTRSKYIYRVKNFDVVDNVKTKIQGYK
jgi:hypothetical protein